MKRITFFIIIVVVMALLVKKEKLIEVPDESIRFRVIAASNSKEDIFIKEKLANQILNNSKELFNSNNIIDSRSLIVNNLDKVENIILETFKKNNYDKKYDINYGINYFPEKIYKGIRYNSGYYESLVITIDEGKGNNYWCVMFPPLCMIDENINKEDIKYKFKVLEIIESIKK